MSSPLPKSLFERAADGCHKFNFVINAIVIIATVSYATGKLNTKVEMVQDQQIAIQRQLSDAATQVAKLDDRVRVLSERLARVEVLVKLDSYIK